MAYAVAQRTRELGIRMALGAQRGALVRLVVGRGLRVILVAVPAGIVGAFAVARLLTHQLFGISAADPLSFVVAPAVLSLAALAAAYLPARHAARADPLDALRAE
jgi:putative ABC transport system permease protein